MIQPIGRNQDLPARYRYYSMMSTTLILGESV